MSEWKALTLGHLSTQRKGINYKSEDYGDEHSGHPFITIKCFVKGGGYEPTGIKFYDGFSTKADHLSPGDLLFSVTDLTRAGDIVGSPLRVPDFGSTKPALASMDCMRIEPIANRCNKRFLYHRLMLSDVRRQMVAYAAGSTVLHLDTTKVPSITVRIPVDVNLQSRIADVLDSIDSAIEKTEALIAKYQQIKAGLMHDLFTRGVLPNGQLRPPREQAPERYQEAATGWIPREWDVCRISDCGDVKLGRQRSPDQHSGKWSKPYLRVANVFDGFIDFSDVLEMDFTPSERETFAVNDGDVLLNEGQSLELVGRSSIYRGESGVYCFQNTLVRFRCNPENLPDFFAHLFKKLLDEGAFQRIAKQTTSVAHLGSDRFAKMMCVKVARDEQGRISERLTVVDNQLAKLRDQHTKLGKQKQGLMHDLLTGKVPVKIEEPEVVDG